MEHRNSQKRFIEEDYVYFVTSKTFQNFPYFREEIFCELWIEELKLCKELKKFELYAFCLCYDHFHMVVKPRKGFDISKVMQTLKCYFSQDANKILGYNPIEGESSSFRLQVVHKLKQWKNEFNKKYTPQKQSLFPKFQWQRSFHDHVIRTQKDLEAHLHYTVFNYLKHELPEDWKYTSLNYERLVDEI